MHTIAILGSVLNGGACQIIDAVSSSKSDYNFLLYDDVACLSHSTHLGYEIRGGIDCVFDDQKSGLVSNFVVGVCSLPFRGLIYARAISNGLSPINIISESALLSETASIGRGNVILPSTYIGPNARIGDNNYITTGTHINHDCIVGNSNYFSTCVAVAGRVEILDNVRLGSNCTVAADAVVPRDSIVTEGTTFYS